MADRGGPNVQASFPLGGQITVNDPRQRPQVPYGIGGGSLGFPAHGGVGGLQGLLRQQLLRRRLQNPPTINPYKDIEGYDDYSNSQQPRGDALSRWPRDLIRPGQDGYPTRDRVEEISRADAGLRGVYYGAPRGGGGQGAGLEDYTDVLRRMLALRYGG